MRRLAIRGAVSVALLLGALTPSAAEAAKSRVAIPKLGAGFAHACGVVGPKAVSCWGANDQAQLGNGPAADPFDYNPLPTDVPGEGEGVEGVVGGLGHTCALVEEGEEVRCWGWNALGQLGTGDTTDRTVPTVTTRFAGGFGAITAGKSHTCVAAKSGEVACWGHNEFGQLGNGRPGCDPNDLFACHSVSPVVVPGMTGVTQLSAGYEHTCALTSAGAVFCWGANHSGQLGIGGPVGEEKTQPVPVSGLASGVAAISAGGDHTCALMKDGAIKCWGANFTGQLGDGTTTDRPAPTTIVRKGGAMIAAGVDHTCAVGTKGGVTCWGRNQYGELGDGTQKDRREPGPVTGLGRGSGVLQIAAGYQYTCALLQDDDVRCWGKNQFGQVGDGTTTTRKTPAPALFACLGESPTIIARSGGLTTGGTSEADVIMGTPGDDKIIGGGDRDLICGLGGNDRITAGEEAIEASGGSGDDLIEGGPASDQLAGGPGADEIEGGGANDVISGDAGDDKLRGDGENDTISGGAGVDLLLGADGNDTLRGGDGVDAINGGRGEDTAFGGDDDDLVAGGSHGDELSGDEGSDHVVGGTGTDKLIGGLGEDDLNGGSGRDRLQGGGGDDFLNGGPDPDNLFGEGDDDELVGNGGRDRLVGGPGRDRDDGGGDGDRCAGEVFKGCADQDSPG